MPGRVCRRAAVALLCALAAAPASAQKVWDNGAGTGIWSTNTADGNWSGAAFTNGDAVVFDGTAPGSVTLTNTVAPSAMHWTGGSYSLLGGTWGGTGTLHAGGGGMLTVRVAGDAAIDLTRTGGTWITNGIVRPYSALSADAPQHYDLGSGSLTLDGGTLQIRTSSSFGGSHRASLTSRLDVASAGGHVVLEIPQWLRDGMHFEAGVGLGGDLTLTAPDVNFSLFDLHVVELRTNAVLHTVDQGTSDYTVTLTAVSNGGPSVLTLEGDALVHIAGANSNRMDCGGLVLNNARGALLGSQSVTVGASSGNKSGLDPLGLIRARGGQVHVGTGITVRIARGDWHPADFAFTSNNVLALALGGQAGTAWFATNLVITAAPGAAHELDWTLGQNNYIGTAPGSAVIIASGGVFRITGAGQNARVRGELQLRAGARWDMTWNGGQYFQRTGGTLRFGDGTNTTAETIEIVGRMNTPATDDTVQIDYPASALVDDGNTILRYANLAGGSNTQFCLSWNFGVFRGGSAGTRFAPTPNTLGFSAVGGTNDPVFVVTNICTLETAGRVAFHRSSGNARGDLGALQVTNGGVLAMTTSGSVHAADVYFAPGTAWQVTLPQLGTNHAGRIVADGAVSFDGEVTLGVTPTFEGTARTDDAWLIAEATGGFTGRPTPDPGYAVDVVPGTPARLLLRPLPTGTVLLVE